MKITKSQVQVLHAPADEQLVDVQPKSGGMRAFVTVKMMTDEGIEGIGLTFAPALGLSPLAPALKSAVDALCELAEGQDPMEIEAVMQGLREKTGGSGPGGILTLAMAAVDMALWDIKGKIANMPLYKLLGGFTNKIDTYVAGGYYEEGKGLKELAEEMEHNVDLGVRAVKMKVGALSINEDVERVRVAREAVGPDIRLMVDANNAYRHYQAIEFARKTEIYDLFWFEEPVEPDDYIGQAEITRATSIPIAAGENEYTRYGFRDMINARSVDILQPDALVLGGVTEFMKIAALAQANDLDLAPHGKQEVHIHLVCAIPNGLILEYYADKFDAMHGNVFKDTLEIKDGYVYAPDRPGLGMELNSEFLAKYRVG